MSSTKEVTEEVCTPILGEIVVVEASEWSLQPVHSNKTGD